ncbi:MAG: hypothetical protein V4725_18975 [Bacteroidota bacterium]
MLVLLSAFLLPMVALLAQPAKAVLDIQLNKNILEPGDSLLVTVDYKRESGQIAAQSLATLELMIENEDGQRTRLRWPVINGKASGALYLPESLPRGKYTLLAGLQERFFEVVGKIDNAKNIGSIQAMLLGKSGQWDQQDVSVQPDGSFAIRNWLFEEDALMAFSSSRNSNQALNIRISTQLDSSFAPLAVAGKSFYIGKPPATVRQGLNQPVETSVAAFTDQGTLLPAVMVRTTAKTPAQQFNDEHVSGMFRAGDERILSIMTDPSAFGAPNIFAYLQGRVPGLQIAQSGFNAGVARWRGSRVTFFLDEMRVSAQQVANIPMTDIAIVKAYPPPFFGASGGGGGIAIYTRRGGEANYLPENKQVFKVRGYTPTALVLNMDKMNL